MLLLKDNVLTKVELSFHKDDLVVRVPHVADRQSLFNQLKERLSFPEYFGDNWDALDEVMRDFEWITNKKIVLIHEKMPSLSEKDLKIYLDILQNAVSVHLERGVQELIVVFSEDDEELLSKYFKIV